MNDQDAAFDAQLAAALGGTTEESAEKPAESEKPAEQETEQSAEAKAPALSDRERAIALGWNPDKEEYEAKTGKEWVSPGTFLRQRDMADEISRSHKTTKQLRRELDQLKKLVNTDLSEIHSERSTRQLTDLQQQIMQAAADQDFDKINELILKRDEIVAPKAPAQTAADSLYAESHDDIAKEVTAWKRENPWFGNDPDITREARALEAAYVEENPGCSVKESLNYAKSRIERMYPELKPAPRKPLAAPDASPRTATRPAAKSYTASDLSGPDRMVFDRMVRAGHLKTDADKQAFIKETLGV